MTGEEKRKILKEQYKKELLERKAFLEKAKKLRKVQRINQALENMESAMHDDSDEWINKLNEESALAEAKMELLLDESEVSEGQKKLDDIQMQAELAKKQAEDMVLQMKRELGLLTEEEEKALAKKEEPGKIEAQASEEKKDPTPPTSEEENASSAESKKTLGDF